MFLTKDWLDNRLNQLDNYDSIISFKNEVEEYIEQQLFASEWVPSEFFLLTWAAFLAEYLPKMQQMLPSINLTERAQGIMYQLPPAYYEIQEAIASYNVNFEKTYTIFNQKMHAQAFEHKVSPIDLIELIEAAQKSFCVSLRMIRRYQVFYPPPKKNPPFLPEDYSPPITTENISSEPFRPLVPSWLSWIIRCSHYKLDPTVAKQGVFPVLRLDINEAAQYLGISPNRIIETCLMEKSIGVYLKKGQFKIRKFITSNGQGLSRNFINETSNPQYLYHYKGLVRLEKSSNLYPDKTLEKIYEGSDIEVAQGESYTIVPLQSSLTEFVQGISQVIELRKGQKITVNDFIFVQNELRDHKHMPEEMDDVPLALRKFVTEHMKHSKILKPKQLWMYLQKIIESNTDRCEVITEISDWEDLDAKISYKTSVNTDEKNISKKRFQNLVGEIKKTPAFK